jgi:hypothetical protein
MYSEEKSALAGEGGGVHAHTLSLCLPSQTKLQCTLQLRGQIHSPICYVYVWLEMFSLYLPNWRMRGGQGGGVYGAL